MPKKFRLRFKLLPHTLASLSLDMGSMNLWWLTCYLEAGFVFYAPACRTAPTGAWLFWAVGRSSDFRELDSLWLITNNRWYRPIQIVVSIRITEILHRRTCVAHLTYRREKGAVRCTTQSLFERRGLKDALKSGNLLDKARLTNATCPYASYSTWDVGWRCRSRLETVLGTPLQCMWRDALHVLRALLAVWPIKRM